MRGILLLSSISAAAAQAPTWFGLRPAQTAQTLELIDLADSGAVNAVVGSIPLGAGETPWPDAVRCLPGFCLFATTAGAGAAATSFICKFCYNAPTPHP